MVFVAELIFLIGIYKVLSENFATSFTLPSVLLPAVQASSLSLDAISKSFYYTNLGNYNI